MPVVETTWNLDDIEDDSEWTNLDSDEEGQQEGQEGEGNENPQPPVPQPAPSPPPVPAASRPRARVRAPPSAAAVPRAKPTRASTQAATKTSLECRETMITGPILNPARQTSFPVGTLVRLYNEGTIDLDPEYQRSVVWNADKQSALIESVYRNMHVPQLLFRVIRSDDGSETRVCIDGKQRLTSFKRFLNNEIPCKDSYSGKSFWIDKDPTGKKRTLVPPPMKSLFELKQVSCMEYEDVTPENERELFQRVQLGVSLSPADRLPAINGLYAELVRTLRNRVNTTKEFEGYLAWGRERGRDFQALAQIVHLILYGQTKKAEPTSSRLETLLRTTTEGLTAAQKASEKVMDIYCRIAQHPGLGEPLRKDLSPLEFVMSAYLIQLHRKKLSDTQLSDAITHMRTDAKQNLADFKFNTKNFKHIMSFLQKRIPKLIPNLKVDPNDPKPANDVKYQRIEVEVDQFKCLDSAEATEPGQKIPAKRKKEEEKKEEDTDADDESDYTVPMPKKKRALTRKVVSQTPSLETKEEAKPKSRLTHRAPGSAKTTVKKNLAKTKAQPQSAVPAASTSTTKSAPSTTAKKTARAGPSAAEKQKPDTQTATPTIRPSPSARSLSRAGSAATNRDSSNSCAPTPPASNVPSPTAPLSMAARPPLPGRGSSAYPPSTSFSTTTTTQALTITSTNNRTDTACTVTNSNIPQPSVAQPPVAPSSSSSGLSAAQDRLAPLRNAKALANSNRSINTGTGAPASTSSAASTRTKLPNFKKMSVADVQPTADPDDAWSATWGALYSTAPTTTVVGQQRQQFAPRKSAPPTTTPMVSAQVLVPHGAVSAGPNVGIGPANVRTGPLVTPASTPSPTLRSQAPQWGLHQPGGPVGSQPPLSQAPAIRQPYAVRDPWLAHAHVNRIAYQPAPSSSTTAAAASAASALATLPPAATAPSPSVTTFSTLPPAAAPNNQTDPAGSAGQKRARTDEDPTEDEGQSDVARRPRSFFPDGRPNHPDNSFNSRG